MNQMIIMVGEGADFDQMPVDLQKAIQAARIEWPESQMPGTVAVNGAKLVLIMSALSGEQLQKQIDAFGLDWRVMAEEGVTVDQKPLLPFFAPDPIWNDEDGDFDYTPVTDLTGRLQTWSGHAWLY